MFRFEYKNTEQMQLQGRSEPRILIFREDDLHLGHPHLGRVCVCSIPANEFHFLIRESSDWLRDNGEVILEDSRKRLEAEYRRNVEARDKLTKRIGEIYSLLFHDKRGV